MNEQKYRCILISDFNISNLSSCLNNEDELPEVDATVAPFGQVISVLMQRDLECWCAKFDFAVIWTQPEKIIKSFNDIIDYKNVPIEEILEEVDRYSSLILDICDRVRFVFVPIWVIPFYYKGLSMFDMKANVGISNILMHMNLRLSENLDKASNIYVLNTEKWIEAVGRNAFNPKLWYMGKIAFADQVFIEGAKNIKAALRGIKGDFKKLIILDLDNILWGGIVGDVGWENIRLGGHDHIGEAYADFQRALKSLTNRGVLLGIVSKNEEAIALEAINNHPEMVIRLDDFVGWKINWQDKAQNIVDLVSDLGLGLQSVVFIDDDPIEQARVREVLSEVLVPEWPEDRMLYKKALLSLNCFNTSSISKEDLKRTEMYVSERNRKDLKIKVGSLDEWLKGLGIKVKPEKLSDSNLQRTTQLLNKTNQMNISTRRMTESELLEWANQEDHRLWTFRVLDKFGDSGLTGIVSLEIKDRVGRIVDFVLSCRVMGRKIEESMVYTVIQYAQSIGLDEIYAKYIPTHKNKPCLEFWKKSGFMRDEIDSLFKWKISNDYPVPEYIQIEE